MVVRAFGDVVELSFAHVQTIEQWAGQEFLTPDGDFEHDLAVAKVISDANPHVQN